jgi:hypothetical protein
LTVGATPTIRQCPDGLLECTCMHEMVCYAFGIVGPHTMEVVEFWQAHPNGDSTFVGRDWPGDD